MELCIAQRERGIRLVSLTSWNGFFSFQCHFSREVILTSSACNNIFVSVEPAHCWDSSVGGVFIVMSVIQFWFSLEWGCDVGDLECGLARISRDVEGMIIACDLHHSDWISTISHAHRHYLRVSTAITLSRMTLKEL